MRHFRRPIVAILIMTMIIGMMSTSCSKSYRNISVFDIEGIVTIFRGNKTLEAYRNMMLKSGDKVSVAEGGYLRLCLDSNKYVYLDENTVIDLVAVGNAKKNRTNIYIENGQMVTEIQEKLNKKSSFEIVTPNTTMAIRGTITSQKVEHYDDKSVKTINEVVDGEVQFLTYSIEGDKLIAKSSDMQKGQSFTFVTEDESTVDKEEYLNSRKHKNGKILLTEKEDAKFKMGGEKTTIQKIDILEDLASDMKIKNGVDDAYTNLIGLETHEFFDKVLIKTQQDEFQSERLKESIEKIDKDILKYLEETNSKLNDELENIKKEPIEENDKDIDKKDDKPVEDQSQNNDPVEDTSNTEDNSGEESDNSDVNTGDVQEISNNNNVNETPDTQNVIEEQQTEEQQTEEQEEVQDETEGDEQADNTDESLTEQSDETEDRTEEEQSDENQSEEESGEEQSDEENSDENKTEEENNNTEEESGDTTDETEEEKEPEKKIIPIAPTPGPSNDDSTTDKTDDEIDAPIPVAKEYTVIFNLNGGEFVGFDAISSDFGESYTTSNESSFELPSCEKYHYNFDGWYDNGSFNGNRLYSIPEGFEQENIQLYAKWTAQQFTLVYHLNGGVLVVDGVSQNDPYQFTSNFDETTSPINNGLAKSGYTFGGWKLSNETESTVGYLDELEDVSNPIDLYAQWDYDYSNNVWVYYMLPYTEAIKCVTASCIGTVNLSNLPSDNSDFDSIDDEMRYELERNYIPFAGWTVQVLETVPQNTIKPGTYETDPDEYIGSIIFDHESEKFISAEDFALTKGQVILVGPVEFDQEIFESDYRDTEIAVTFSAIQYPVRVTVQYSTDMGSGGDSASFRIYPVYDDSEYEVKYLTDCLNNIDTSEVNPGRIRVSSIMMTDDGKFRFDIGIGYGCDINAVYYEYYDGVNVPIDWRGWIVG